MFKRIRERLNGTARARRTVEEFARKFPGRCMVCSMHRYGYTHGHERNPLPAPHDCIERKGVEASPRRAEGET